MIEPSGPTEHLDTVEYWKEGYLLAVEEGQKAIDRANEAESTIRRIRRRLEEIAENYGQIDTESMLIAVDRAVQHDHE